ncbi:RhoGAP domain-containing protein [Reticulomyxa filosa]|uniref:RhoGAP domain-containing protein n=1 Tax=Reticulomyxa filosa TaxID=46433 RepID=X6NU96_RETFI|nr:RhoGAP domain-containing protein [Reticulomyxa filosa]|eukprot:ETO28837.1 RhoGAP domain-containing protein [Reticulomyxa filosa]
MDWDVSSEYFEWEVLKEWKQYTEKKKVNIFCSTYNVNAKNPSSERNESGIKLLLLDPNMLEAYGGSPDIYVMAFQEIVDLNNATSYLMESEVKLEWEQCVGKVLGSDYSKVCSKSMVGLLLLAFAKTDMVEHISDCLVNTCAVGLFGTVGNKGGIGFHMKFYDSHLCFISSHLAAQQNNVQGRNQDFWKIIENLKFLRNEEKDREEAGNDESKQNKEVLQKKENNDPDNTLFGSTEEWKTLLAKDQMILERTQKNAFAEFAEPDIDFPPTYKYQPHTKEYDRRPDKKVRMPAWCDRVLWRRGKRPTGDIGDVKCLKYDAVQDLTMSDHRPVYAWLTYESFQSEGNGSQTQRSSRNSLIPAIRADNELSFPSVKYGESSARHYTIFNIGNVPVRYEFGPSPQNPSLPGWLKIDRPQGTIPVKEKVQVKIEILVTSNCCKKIMDNHNRIDETILLGVGQEVLHFVTIHADYIPSCFGQKLDYLIRLKEPIRFVEITQSDKEKDKGSNSTTDLSKDDSSQVLSIPKELWRLVEHLYKNGMDTESIFITKGSQNDIAMIRECLDTNKDFEKCDIHSFGEALVRFLEGLQDPVFPASLCSNFDENTDITQYCRQALTILPLSHYNTFLYVVSFLREVLKHSSRNRLTVDRLAYQFSCALTQSTVDLNGKLQNHKPFLLLKFFLSHPEL